MQWIVWPMQHRWNCKTDSTSFPKIVEAPTAADAVQQEYEQIKNKVKSERWIAVPLHSAYVVSIKPRREYDVLVKGATTVFTGSSFDTKEDEDEEDLDLD